MLTQKRKDNLAFLMRCERSYGNPYYSQSRTKLKITNLRKGLNFKTLIWHPELIVNMKNPTEKLEAWLLDEDGNRVKRVDQSFKVIATMHGYYEPEGQIARWRVRPVDKRLVGKTVEIYCPAVVEYIPSGDYLLTPQTRLMLNPHYSYGLQ